MSARDDRELASRERRRGRVLDLDVACREPEVNRVYGTQMVVLENINEAKQPAREEIARLMRLLRSDGEDARVPHDQEGANCA